MSGIRREVTRRIVTGLNKRKNHKIHESTYHKKTNQNRYSFSVEKIPVTSDKRNDRREYKLVVEGDSKRAELFQMYGHFLNVPRGKIAFATHQVYPNSDGSEMIVSIDYRDKESKALFGRTSNHLDPTATDNVDLMIGLANYFQEHPEHLHETNFPLTRFYENLKEEFSNYGFKAFSCNKISDQLPRIGTNHQVGNFGQVATGHANAPLPDVVKDIAEWGISLGYDSLGGVIFVNDSGKETDDKELFSFQPLKPAYTRGITGVDTPTPELLANEMIGGVYGHLLLHEDGAKLVTNPATRKSDPYLTDPKKSNLLVSDLIRTIVRQPSEAPTLVVSSFHQRSQIFAQQKGQVVMDVPKSALKEIPDYLMPKMFQ
jgi:hypothetical protein